MECSAVLVDPLFARTATGSNTPDLEQFTMLILEGALLRSAWQRSGTPPE